MAEMHVEALGELGNEGILQRRLPQGAARAGGNGYSSKVQGFQPDKGTLNLDIFGHGFRTNSFA